MEYITTAMACRDLNIKTTSNEDDRTLLVNKPYIAKNLGLSLGFRFYMGYHFIACPEIYPVLIDIYSEGFECIEKNTFKEKYMNIINEVNNLSNIDNKYNFREYEIYLVLSTILYYHDLMVKPGIRSKVFVINKCTERLPFVHTEEEAEYYYDVFVNKLLHQIEETHTPC